MNRLGSAVIVVAVALVSGCLGGTSTGQARNVIRIGVDLPMSGAEARSAAPALYGIKFYVQTHPTIDGFTVELRNADDEGEPSLGAANVRAFLTDPHLIAMLGPFDASVARQEIPVANAADLAMVSPATSNPCLTRDVFTPARLNPSRIPITCKQAGLPAATDLRPSRKNNFFRLTTTDELQGAAAAEYAFRKLRLLRAGVVSDREAYGQGLAYAFSARFTSLGGTVTGQFELDPKNPSAAGFLKSARADGAQAIYYGGGTGGGGCAMRAEMATIFDPREAAPMLGGDGIAEDPACVTAAGQNSLGIYATVPIVDADSRPAAASTIRSFKAAFGSTADYGPYTIVAYDATAVLYSALGAAIQAAGGVLPGRRDVTAKVALTDGLAGVTGTLGFDRAGDTINRVVSVFEATSANPRVPWKAVDAVDYSAKLPY